MSEKQFVFYDYVHEHKIWWLFLRIASLSVLPGALESSRNLHSETRLNVGGVSFISHLVSVRWVSAQPSIGDALASKNPLIAVVVGWPMPSNPKV